jgi:kynurenine formamidase
MTEQKNGRLTVLVVILVVVVGMAVLLFFVGGPLALMAVQQARDAARREQARNNLKQIELALHNYHQGLLTKASVQQPDITLTDALAVIRSKQFVDLTHAFEPGIPHWPGFPDEKRETLYWYDEGVGTKGKGFFAQEFTHVGQWGTHCDPPAHFVKGKRTIDQIDPKEMILPLVVIDVHEKAAKNPDYTITMDDVRGWEQRHGPIHEGGFVAMRTDWSKRWPDAKAMRNEDAQGVAHYPGWSKAVLKYLYEERKITASGHETTDTDPGIATSKGDYSLETYILGTDHYQIELLTNLDKVPEAGAIVVVTFPKPKGGSGFPARVFAIVP